MKVRALSPRWRSFEHGIVITFLGLTAVLPLLEFAGRLTVGRGIPGSGPMVQNLTLWIAFWGAALAAASDSLLALATPDLLGEPWRRRLRIATSALAAGITAWLFQASIDPVLVFFESGERIALGIPRWLAFLALPVGFGLTTIHLVRRASDQWTGRCLAAAGLIVPVAFTWWLPIGSTAVTAVGLLVVGVGTGLGMPIFAGIGGAALVLFWADAFPVSAVAYEAQRLAGSPYLPAIPLFTLGGYVLAKGGAGERLIALFSAVIGWIPGGLAIAVTLLLAFFTPLTGASGVTILAMGGLVLPIMTRAGYPEPTSVGLVTASGSIGLLLPPSLPVILYAVYGTGQGRVVPIDQLFVGSLVPGFLLIVAVGGWAAFRGWKAGAWTTPFRAGDALKAVGAARWDVLLPVLLLGGFFGGVFASLVEAAAFVVAYAVIVECVLYRNLDWRRDLGPIMVECTALVGSFFVILGAALAFNNYLLTAGAPQAAVLWVQQHVTSPIVFLFALNVLLVVVGALMDIYSAIFVIAPLVAPIGAAYGIDPVHLGVVFLANMELGYLMPPMGENLFLSAMRFGQPLSKIYVSTVPFVILLALVVLMITYVPQLTLWLVAAYQE